MLAQVMLFIGWILLMWDIGWLLWASGAVRKLLERAEVY